MLADLAATRALFLADVSALEGVPRVMRTGELQLVRASDDPLLCQTGTGSGIIAPLVATISHDLKNPLATVRGQAQLLSCSSSASRSSWFDLR
jgi:signal transduction histidine kinase